jgi:hypothetical protein
MEPAGSNLADTTANLFGGNGRRVGAELNMGPEAVDNHLMLMGTNVGLYK